MATTMMSRSRSQGTEVTIVIGAFPFELSRDITEDSPLWDDIQSRRERGYEACTRHTLSEDRIRTNTLPTNSDTIRRAHS